jgi:hypothetical protein
MAAKPGTLPPNAGKGRKKGTPNNLTREIKLAIENAFIELGGEKYLVRVGKKRPDVFCALIGKLLPMQITGKDGGPIQAETQYAGREELLRRVREAAARAVAIGLSTGAPPLSQDGSVLPAALCIGQDGHGASVVVGPNPGSAG